MSKTKIVALISCALLLLTMFAGCGNPSPAASDNSAPAQSGAAQSQGSAAAAKQVTLKLLVDNQTAMDGVKAECDYIEQKLNIKTEIELRPGGPEGENVVKTRLATGDMDDLCFFNAGSLFLTLNPEANFVDLTNEPYMANVMDSFKSTVSVNGKVFSVPSASTQAGAILYNKKVYTQLGLSVPKTWNDFLANCEKIKAAGKTAVIASYKDNWSAQLIILSDNYNVMAQVPTFPADFTAHKTTFSNTPAALRGFEKIQELFKKGYYNKDFLTTTYETAQKMLIEGTGVQYPMLTGTLLNIGKSYPDKVNDIGVFAQPSDSADINGLTVWMPAGISVYKNGKNVDTAKKWIEAFVSPEAVAANAEKAPATGPFVIKGVKLPDSTYDGIKEMQPYFDGGKTAPALEFNTPVKGPNLPQICVEAGSGLKSPLDCAKEYDKDVEKQAKQLNLAGW